MNNKDALLLLLIYRREKKGEIPYSFQELRDDFNRGVVGTGISLGTLHTRISRFREAGYIAPVPTAHKVFRAIKISETGIELLRNEGLINDEQKANT